MSDESAPVTAGCPSTSATLTGELLRACTLYASIREQIGRRGELDQADRDRCVEMLANVAVTLRRATPFLAQREGEDTERVDLALVLLRLITDSLAIALGASPQLDLMVAPAEVEAVMLTVGLADESRLPSHEVSEPGS